MTFCEIVYYARPIEQVICLYYNRLPDENINGIQFSYLAQIGQIHGFKY